MTKLSIGGIFSGIGRAFRPASPGFGQDFTNVRTEIVSYTREFTNRGVNIIPVEVRALSGRSRGKGGKQAHRKTGVRAIRRAAGKI